MQKRNIEVTPSLNTFCLLIALALTFFFVKEVLTELHFSDNVGYTLGYHVMSMSPRGFDILLILIRMKLYKWQ